MLVPFRTGRALKGFAREDFEFPRKVAKGRFLIPQRKGADKNETLHLRSSFVRKDFKLPLEGFGRMSFRLPNEGGGRRETLREHTYTMTTTNERD